MKLPALFPATMAGAARMKVRPLLCAAAASAAFLGLGVRLVDVALSGEAYARRAATAASAEVPRREIVDVEGRPLAMNARLNGLAVDGRDVWDPEETAMALARVFRDLDPGPLAGRLASRKYTHLFDAISAEEQRAVVALGLPGMRFPETTGRAYPQKDLAAHVVGYVIPGRGGAIGAERALDDGPFADGAGRLRLSIDLVAQQVLEEELGRSVAKFDARAAWGVLLDIRTGEVRALASLPDFNPNRPGTGHGGAWRNRALAGRYELGSAFKPLTVAAALDAGLTTVNERIDVSGPIAVGGGWTIEDYSDKGATLSVAEVLQHSSNIGTVKIAQRLGVEGFKGMLDRLGLSEAIATELPERQAPGLPRRWGTAELATASYGHGIAVTPLGLAAAFGAVVNGGVYRTPSFSPGGTEEARLVLKEETSALMRLILRRTVTDGTGRKADVPGYYVIGKTATADKPSPTGGYDEDGPLISSFIGAFPGYDPAYVLLVSLDEPRGTRATYGYATAGYTAAPTFRRVVERSAPALGIMPVGDAVAFDGFLGLDRPSFAAASGAGADDAIAALLRERGR